MDIIQRIADIINEESNVVYSRVNDDKKVMMYVLYGTTVNHYLTQALELNFQPTKENFYRKRTVNIPREMIISSIDKLNSKRSYKNNITPANITYSDVKEIIFYASYKLINL